MAWFKVDDQLHSHPKARRAGLEAMGLWLVAGSHCMSYLTDGFVEEWFVLSWPNGAELAERLVGTGLWLRGDGGWQFHDWGEFQPTREKVEAEREAASERKRRQRARGSDGRYESRESHGVTPTVTDGVSPAERSSTPSPSPSPRLLLTESVSLGSNRAREDETDSEAQAAAERLAAAMGLDLEKIRTAARGIDRDLGHGQALRLGTIIVAKARREPKNATAYVMGAFRQSPHEVQQWIDTEVMT